MNISEGKHLVQKAKYDSEARSANRDRRSPKKTELTYNHKERKEIDPLKTDGNSVAMDDISRAKAFSSYFGNVHQADAGLHG